jgi:hypothetical protein
VSYSSDFPPRLRLPAGGDITSFTWRADIGADATVGAVAAYLQDLSTAVGLSERWGVAIAQVAATSSVRVRLVSDDLTEREVELIESLGYSLDDLRNYVRYWLYPYEAGPPRRSIYRMPWLLDPPLQLLIDGEALALQGQPVRVRSLEYRNPIELVIGGAGVSLYSLIQLARFIRDWGSERDVTKAGARKANAEASSAESEARLKSWLVDQAISGKIPLAPSLLTNLLSGGDVAALDRLSTTAPELTLPPGQDDDESQRRTATAEE